MDLLVTPWRRRSAKVLSTTTVYSMVAMVTDRKRHLTYNSRGIIPRSSGIICEILSEIQRMDFLKPITHSQII